MADFAGSAERSVRKEIAVLIRAVHPRMFTAEGWVPFIAADFLSADHPRAWEAFQARAAAAEARPCSA